MEGVLYEYVPGRVAWCYGETSAAAHTLLFIGGLMDTFYSPSYTPPLSQRLAKQWGLVHIQLSSFGQGFGTSSIEQDARELDQFIEFWKTLYPRGKLVLMGHSTGCQDIVFFLKHAFHKDRVDGVILQAPVSDREALLCETKEEIEMKLEMLKLAESMITEGKGLEILPRKAFWNIPITAQRFQSLCERGGPDDMFSSDFSDEQLEDLLGHMRAIPCLAIFSMKDQYVPESIDMEKLTTRLYTAMSGSSSRSRSLKLRESDHSVTSDSERAIMFSSINHFLSEIERASECTA